MGKGSQEFRDGMAVLRLCSYVTRQVYLEMLEHMEWKYPDRGWIIMADKLRQFYAEQDKILTEKPDNCVGLKWGRLYQFNQESQKVNRR